MKSKKQQRIDDLERALGRASERAARFDREARDLKERFVKLREKFDVQRQELNAAKKALASWGITPAVGPPERTPREAT